MSLIDKEVKNLKEVNIDNETFYRISNVDDMRPFFMSIVSDSNHWMFIGSNGGLSAGRKDADNALFPYYTDDKIIESVENTGSKSIFLVEKNGQSHVWEPFSIWYSSQYKISRNLYKNVYGNKILFEEINHDLGLVFSYQWNSSSTYGFVRKCSLKNIGVSEQTVTVLDGLQNIMPYGVGSDFQNQNSNLVNAYKRTELFGESSIGTFGLSAIIVDKAEPSEALKANIVWSLGLDNSTHLLSSLQLNNFRNHLPIIEETDIKGEKGSYLISMKITLPVNSIKKWMIIADVNKSNSEVVALSEAQKRNRQLQDMINEDIEKGTQNLVKLNAASDALQLTNDSLSDARHFSNTLFNIMRGGIFDNNYQIEKSDLKNYLSQANREIAQSFEKIIDQLPEVFPVSTLNEITTNSTNASFRRLCAEYLPLKFSRRHGDPSRPWNRFSINTNSEIDGAKILDYEGNWRDIFQNWEALAHSYPEFIEGMIFRFLNASTFDGYNPYRITKNGIDWEKIEPDDPWSYIGYWGDHQIIYLLKFLEFAESHYPGKLESFFTEDLFVYANVPYKIKGYKDLLSNPKDTIDFDHEIDAIISKRWTQLGADSALLRNQKDNIIRVNFVEKLLATVLAKMSNFIPEGGIWMNTQRPEWNDANNALVGNGVSAVTLYYLLRFLSFTDRLIQNVTVEKISLSKELKAFLNEVVFVLEKHKDLLHDNINDKDRKQIMDGLGIAGSNYRQRIYNKSFGGEKEDLKVSEIQQFTDLCQRYAKHTVSSNKRKDNLYHAYNLMSVVNDDEVTISHLSEMLEGQVAVLSSGYLTSLQSLEVLDALKESKLFRGDQKSYLLYPYKDLPGFSSKNNIPFTSLEKSELLCKLLDDGDKTIVEKDVKGMFHFNGTLKNANDLRIALDKLKLTKFTNLLESNANEVLVIFEEVFNHKAFTGRSGTFFGYEGLGSIYWHMVSKLALAAQECCLKAIEEKENDQLINRLIDHYYEINEGLGLHKSPSLYGAFPTDPYSHTPAGKGAQQPGMTGQVKEDILCRFGELGIVVQDGKLGFDPRILRNEEFLEKAQVFNYIDVYEQRKKLDVEPGSICFTYCQVPVVYKLAKEEQIEVVLDDDSKVTTKDLHLDKDLSIQVFQRSGHVKMIFVNINENRLR